MPELAYRNLILFFKDKTTVILSFLAEFIIIGLYLLFMRENLINSFPEIEHADLLMDVWMISGILGITSLSTTMGAYGIMVEDKVRKIDRDFYISPIHSISLPGGYMTSAVLIGFFMSFLLFLFSILYVSVYYGVKLGANCVFTVYGILFLSAISNAALTLLLTSFLKSSNALSACCTILGSLIGFLTGIYLPMGSLPESVQILVKCFPVSHSVVLFRQFLMEPLISENFGGIETASAQQFIEYMGIRFFQNGTPMAEKISVCFLLVSTLICMTIVFIKFHLLPEN